MYNNVDVRHGCYGKIHYDDKGKEKYFEEKGNAVFLDEICKSIEDNNVVWRVSFDYLGERQYFELERQKISDKKLMAELQGKGADITSTSFNCFVDSMRFQEAKMEGITNTFEKTGWIKIAYNGKMLYHYRSHKLIGNLMGEYIGNLALKSIGTFEAWREMIINEVIGRTPLEVVLLASMSAIINGLIANSTTGENPIIHICSESGCGKSTAAFVAASVYGAPFEGGKVVLDKYKNRKNVVSVLGSWSATENAVITSHSGNHGTVAIMNELGKFKGKDLTQAVYSLSEGTDKTRLDEKYNIRVKEGFSTAIISIGEFSILDRCSIKAKGLDIRVMELTDQFTDDAPHSRRLKKSSRENNGWAAQVIAKYIIDHLGLDGVLNTYNRILEEETKNAPSEKHRFIEKFTALFLTTAEIAYVSLGISFNIDSIREYCDEFWDKKVLKQGSVSQSFTEAVEYFEINQSNFYTVHNSEKVPKPFWGRICKPKTVVGDKILVKEYAVIPQVLKDFLISKGYNNPTTELKIWRSKGALNCDDKHLTRKYAIDPHSSDQKRVYVLQIWEENVKPPSIRKGKYTSKLLEVNDDDECDSESSNKEATEDENANPQ